MALPPGFLDELRARVPLSQVAGRKVTWDLRRSNQSRGDLWAPCPFHQERTASFHVDDRKGFYYCFGCHAKGDAIGFLQQTENLSFIEAVEWLAREAGMPMPARDPQAVQQADRRAQLVEVVEEAVRYYRRCLAGLAAQPARDYLARRRLSAEGQERFGIGYAPDGRRGLHDTLLQKGFDADLIVASGLCARPDDGGAAYDRFRDRIIFPIRDARGRAISLGGRAMDPKARAKYLNGPETELFDKGRSLYNIGPARAAAGKDRPLIVAEGYMDVIALSEAGFPAAVAPLGTAITEDQLRLIWRLHSEPVVALDGDRAGIAAALRLVDLALPLLEAGQGLRFAVLPAGLDPDDLIRAEGAGAMQKLVESARPMVDLLWQRETEGQVFDSPERRAALDKALRAALARIRDPMLRGHYEREVRRLAWDLSRPVPSGPRKGGGRASAVPAAPLAATRGSALAGRGATSDEVLETVLVATLVVHPALVAMHLDDLESLDLSEPDCAALVPLMLRLAAAGRLDGLADRLAEQAGPALDAVMSRNHVQTAPPVRRSGDLAFAAKCFANDLAKLRARRGLGVEVRHAEEDLLGLADEGTTYRVQRASEAVQRQERVPLEEGETAGGPADSAQSPLDRLIAERVWEKKKR